MSPLLLAGMMRAELAPIRAVARAAGFAPLPGFTVVPDADVSTAPWQASTGVVGPGPEWWGGPDLEAMLDGLPFPAVEPRSRAGRDHLIEHPSLPLLLRDARLGPLWSDGDVRCVLVHRAPWDAVEAAVRAGDPWVLDDLERAWCAWSRTADAMVEVAAELGPRCLVVSHEALVLDPASTVSTVGRFLGVEAPRSSTRSVEGADDPIRLDDQAVARFATWLRPEDVERLRLLDAIAAAPRPQRPERTDAPPFRAGGTVPPRGALQVVLTCGDGDGLWLVESLAALEGAAGGPLEVTVVDAASSDAATERALGALRDRGIEVIRSAMPGAASARAVGLARSRSEAVLHVEADIRVTPAMLDALDPVTRGEADAALGAWRERGLRATVVAASEPQVGSLFPRVRIPDCVVVRRELVEAVGGWDAEAGDWAGAALWLGALGVGARFRRLEAVTFEAIVRTSAAERRGPEGSGVRGRGLARLLELRQALLHQGISADVLAIAALAARFEEALGASERGQAALEAAVAEGLTAIDRLEGEDTEVRQLREELDRALEDLELCLGYARMTGAEAMEARGRAVLFEEAAMRSSGDLSRLRATRSWRWTRPLRVLERLVRAALGPPRAEHPRGHG